MVQFYANKKSKFSQFYLSKQHYPDWSELHDWLVVIEPLWLASKNANEAVAVQVSTHWLKNDFKSFFIRIDSEGISTVQQAEDLVYSFSLECSMHKRLLSVMAARLWLWIWV